MCATALKLPWGATTLRRAGSNSSADIDRSRRSNDTNRKHLNPMDPAREQKKCSASGSDRIATMAREREQLSARMQQLHGISKDAADARIDAFANGTKKHGEGG